MTWKPIVGRSFNKEQFDAYVQSLVWGSWKPQFVVVHNTSAPTLKQWHGATPPAQRIKNLEGYYRDEQHWSSGPHLFVADDLIWVFTPLTTPGTHSPSWNSISIGMEMVGEYDIEDFSLVHDNVVSALASIHRKLNLNPTTMRFHKEDPKTTHKDCPGRHVVKETLIQDVVKKMHDFGAPSFPLDPVLPLEHAAPLRLGSTGASVRELQELVGLKGKDVDGQFGVGTLALVKMFQRSHGLDPDGIVGPVTWSVLKRK